MNIIPLTQRTPEWERWRAQGITASEAPVIVGRSPYKSAWQLWAERTGVAKPEDLSANPLVQRGIQREDQVRNAFEERHGTILLPLCVESDAHPVLRCSLDGLNDDGEPVELKVPTDRTYQRLLTEGEEAVAYRIAWVQLQHQLCVTGAARGWLVFDPCLRDKPALEFGIARDEDFLRDELIPACLAFWEAIQTGTAPQRDAARDAFEPTGDALRQWDQVAQQYRALAQQRERLERQLKAVKSDMAEAEGVFVNLLGESRQGEAAGVRVTRYLQVGSVDYAALLKDIAPELDPSVLEQHRRKATERVKVTLQAADGGEEPVDPPPVKSAGAASAGQSFYF